MKSSRRALMGTRLGTRLANLTLVAICALGAVACDSTTPTPSPSPSSSLGSSGTGGTSPGSGSSAGNVLTQHNDGYRTGQNLNETILTRANVNPTDFGKIGALPVDGNVYAQPLVVSGVKTSDGTTHNILYTVTENDSVYAYDTNTLSTTPLWKRSMLGDSDYTCPNSTNGPCTVLTPADTGAPNIAPEIGITSTPVIDQAAGVMYLVSAIKDSTGLIYIMLHGLDLGTGQEVAGSPVTIEGSLPGQGYGTDATTDAQIHFAAAYQLQRAGLVLNNGLVYIALTSWNDQEPSHGWFFSYDEATLEPVSAFMTTPDSGDGTIWQAGGAPAVDENGSIYFATGNSQPGTTRDLGNSVLKLDFGDDGFDLQDYFTPYNYSPLNTTDTEIGSGGVMLIPDQLGATPDLMVAAGKEGTVYLLNRDNMGKFNSTSTTSDTQIVQELPFVLTHGVEGKNYGTGQYGLPAYYQNKIFYAAIGDALRSIPLANDQLDTSSMTVSPIAINGRGASPSISANGNANGIVWYVDDGAYSYSWDATPCTASAPTACYPPTSTEGPAVLYAFSTDSMATPLYSSSPAVQASVTCTTKPCANPPAGTAGASYTGPASDAAGDAVKFAVPTIVNGQVYVPTASEISVYGLRSSKVAQNAQRGTRAYDVAHNGSDTSLSRSVASLFGLQNTTADQASPAAASAKQGPRFDFWDLKSPYHACTYHTGKLGEESSLY